MPAEGKPLVWVTGAGGLIGSYIVRLAATQAPAYEVRELTRRTVDLLDFAEVERLHRRELPSIIIHCAVFKSTLCPTEPEAARRMNTDVPRFLSELGRESHFVFFSSDLVFDGSKGQYTEEDRPNPLALYGETKARAEEYILRNPGHSVIRTSLNGGISPTGDRGFNEEMLKAFRAGKRLRLFVDEFRSPACAEVTARALWEWLPLNRPGIYHIAGSERLSRWEIGQLLAERHRDLNPQIDRGSLKDYQGSPRSPDTSLDCSKIQRLIEYRLPGFREWLRNASPDFF